MSAGGAVEENQDLNVCLASSQTLLFSVLPAQVTHPVASSWVQFLPPGSSQSIYHFFLLIQVLISILSVQSLSHVRLFATPWTAAMPGFPVHHQLPELAQTHVHQIGDVIQPFHPLSSTSPAFSQGLPSIRPSIRVFSNDRLYKNVSFLRIETTFTSCYTFHTAKDCVMCCVQRNKC